MSQHKSEIGVLDAHGLPCPEKSGGCRLEGRTNTSGPQDREACQVAQLVSDHLDETVTYYRYPQSHRPRIRPTNPLQRIMWETRRRTRVVGASGCQFCFAADCGPPQVHCVGHPALLLYASSGETAARRSIHCYCLNRPLNEKRERFLTLPITPRLITRLPTPNSRPLKRLPPLPLLLCGMKIAYSLAWVADRRNLDVGNARRGRVR